MSSAYTNFRYKLKAHFKKFISLEEARRNKPEEVACQDDWEFLCLLFSSEKFKVCIKLFNLKDSFSYIYIITYLITLLTQENCFIACRNVR